MRAAILRDDSGILSIEEVGVDKPASEEVLIQTVASGLCHSDLHFMDGTVAASYPMYLGHEAAGIVQAVGDDVRDITVGDHVIICGSFFCTHCEWCLTGSSHLCENRLRTGERAEGASARFTDAGGHHINPLVGLGSFGEEMLIHQNGVVTITNDMPLDRAALIGCGVTTGVGGVFRAARVTPGSTVAVIGCGGVGISAVQGAHIAGARRIIAIDLEPRKLAWARELGATDVVNPANGDPVGQVLEMTKGGVDFSFECIGRKDTAEQAYGMLRNRGLATIMGMIPTGVNIEIPAGDLLRSGKRLQGALMGANNFKVDMPHLCDLYLGGRLKLDEMISLRVPLDDINQGFDAMKSGEVVRSVVEFT